MFGSVALNQITKPMVRQFRDAMLEIPTRISNEESALPLLKLLEKYSGKDVPRASIASIASIASARKRLSFVKTLLSMAVDAGIIAESPAEGVKIKDDGVRPDKARQAFTYDQLRIIAENLHDRDDSFRWVTILGMTTGCRLGELVQLTAADVRVEEGISYLSINAAGGKTASSIRSVPLHPAVRGAFLEFVKGREGRLFPDIRPGTNGDVTDLIVFRRARLTPAAG